MLGLQPARVLLCAATGLIPGNASSSLSSRALGLVQSGPDQARAATVMSPAQWEHPYRLCGDYRLLGDRLGSIPVPSSVDKASAACWRQWVAGRFRVYPLYPRLLHGSWFRIHRLSTIETRHCCGESQRHGSSELAIGTGASRASLRGRSIN